MKALTIILSLLMAVISTIAAVYGVKNMRGGWQKAILGCAVCVSVSEVFLTVALLITYNIWAFKGIVAGMMFLLTLTLPFSLSLICIKYSGLTGWRRVVAIGIGLLPFNCIYACNGLLFDPWWAYCVIVDAAAIISAFILPLSTAKAIISEITLALSFAVYSYVADFSDHIRDDAYLTVFLSAITFVVLSKLLRDRNIKTNSYELF